MVFEVLDDSLLFGPSPSGVSSSSFVANMSLKQNAAELAEQYSMASAVTEKSFYIDDGLAGADSVDSAIELRVQLQSLFSDGGLLLRK